MKSTRSAVFYFSWTSPETSTRPPGKSYSETSQVHLLGKVARRMLNKDILKRLRRQYPVGYRAELLRRDDTTAPPIGTQGTVMGIDATGSIMIDWDNSSGLNVLYGIDHVRKAADAGE